MDAQALRAALAAQFPGSSLEADGLLDVVVAHGDQRWGFALCPDREDGMAYLGAFEAAMQRLVDARNAYADGLRLGIAIAFAATAAGQHPSYRRALKKYSNSIVFEDLDLSLFLVRAKGNVIALEPQAVNPFLRNLNEWIAAQKSNA